MPVEPYDLRAKGLFGLFDASVQDRPAPAPGVVHPGPFSVRDEASVIRFRGGLMGLTDPAHGSVYESADVVAIVWGTPRIEGVHDRLQVARHIGQEFLRTGIAVLGALRGGFSLAVFDPNRGAGLIALDRMGRHILYCVPMGQAFGFASSAEMLLPLLGNDVAIQNQAIADYLYFHMIPGPDTLYRGMRRVEAGEVLEYRAGKIAQSRYWTPEFHEDRSPSFPTAKDRFVRLIESAVRNDAENESAGCFLSGGTDSSTVAGMLCRVSGAPARTFSIGFSAAGYDEMEYARIASRHFGTRHSEYYVTPQDVVEAIPLIAKAYDQPFGNSSAVPTFFCAQFARSEGISRMLAGDGGDELFGGNQRYADQYVFSLYERVPRILRAGLLEPLARLPGASLLPPTRKLRSYIERASVPMPRRLEAYNAFERFGVHRIFTEDFLSTVDADRPIAMQDEVYHNAQAGTLLNRMLALDFKFTLADNDLRKVGRMCEVAGVEVAYPLLDDEIVEFSLALPPDYKLKGTRLRDFFKRALEDFLPAEIIRKKKHGFGLPFGIWARDYAPLRELAYGAVSDLKKRGIVRAEFLDRLVAGHRTEHAAYYGGQLWVFMMLELWLHSHLDDARR